MLFESLEYILDSNMLNDLGTKLTYLLQEQTASLSFSLLANEIEVMAAASQSYCEALGWH